MKKSEIQANIAVVFILIAMVSTAIGAFAIHWVLGLFYLGALFTMLAVCALKVSEKEKEKEKEDGKEAP